MHSFFQSFIVFCRVLTVADAERKVWDSYEREGEDRTCLAFLFSRSAARTSSSRTPPPIILPPSSPTPLPCPSLPGRFHSFFFLFLSVPSARPHLYSPSFFYFTLADANPFRKRRRASVIVGWFRCVRDSGGAFLFPFICIVERSGGRVRVGSDFDFIFAILDLGDPDRAARGVGCATHPPFLRVSRTGERKEAGGGGDDGEVLPAGCVSPFLLFFFFWGGTEGAERYGRAGEVRCRARHRWPTAGTGTARGG